MTDPDPGPAPRPRRGDSAGPMRFPVPQRKRRGEEPPTYVILTPTEREARQNEIAERQRRYLKVMIPCFVLVLFGFFCTFAPTAWRLVAIGIGSFLPPIAAMVGNT